MVLLVSVAQERHLEKSIGNWSLRTTHVRRMNNVAMYQNGVYTHNINKIFTRMTTNTIDTPLETEYTSSGIRYIKTNLVLCSNHSQYTLQHVDIWKNCNVTISRYTYNFSIDSLYFRTSCRHVESCPSLATINTLFERIVITSNICERTVRFQIH